MPVGRAVLIFARATGEPGVAGVSGPGEYEVGGLAELKREAALAAAEITAGRVSAPVGAG